MVLKKEIIDKWDKAIKYDTCRDFERYLKLDPRRGVMDGLFFFSDEWYGWNDEYDLLPREDDDNYSVESWESDYSDKIRKKKEEKNKNRKVYQNDISSIEWQIKVGNYNSCQMYDKATDQTPKPHVSIGVCDFQFYDDVLWELNLYNTQNMS